MEIFNKVKEICQGYDLSELATRFGYPADTKELILSDNEADFRKKYYQTYYTLLTCKSQKDSRTPFEYGKDIATMWLIEDFAMFKLQEHGINVRRNGVDKGRKILKSGDINGSSDFIVTDGDKDVKIEFVTDFTRFWEKARKIDFRNSKYENMVENGSVLFGLAFDTNNKDYKKYLLLENLGKYDHIHYDEHPVWKKPANRVFFNSNEVKNLDWDEIANRIKEIIDKR